MVNFFHPLHRDVAANGVIFKTPFHRQQCRFSKAGVSCFVGQADVKAVLHIARNNHLATFDDQHIGA